MNYGMVLFALLSIAVQSVSGCTKTTTAPPTTTTTIATTTTTLPACIPACVTDSSITDPGGILAPQNSAGGRETSLVLTPLQILPCEGSGAAVFQTASLVCTGNNNQVVTNVRNEAFRGQPLTVVCIPAGWALLADLTILFEADDISCVQT